MVNYWVVRAGDAIKDLVEAGSFIGIDFGGEELGNLAGVSLEEVRQKVRERRPDASAHQIGSVAGQLYRFSNVMKEGDRVLTPLKPSRMVLVGEVAGSYEFASREPNPHRRKVDWLTKFSRDDVSVPLKRSLGGERTVYRIDGHTDEIARLAEGVSSSSAPTGDGEELDREEFESDILYAADIEAKARERIKDLIFAQSNGRAFEGVIAALLKAMGYQIIRGPLPGADGGIDIIAAPDVFGLAPPRIYVQVKHRNSATSGGDVAQLLGSIDTGGKGLFVSTGGFTRDARQRGGADVTLLDGDDVVNLIIEHYENLPSEYKAKIPLRRVYLPVPPDER